MSRRTLVLLIVGIAVVIAVVATLAAVGIGSWMNFEVH
jgi:hypothetical protein